MPPTSFLAYSFISNMGSELIWYAALDSKCDLVADCKSQKLIRLILRFQCFFVVLLTVSHSLGSHFDTKRTFVMF